MPERPSHYGGVRKGEEREVESVLGSVTVRALGEERFVPENGTDRAMLFRRLLRLDQRGHRVAGRSGAYENQNRTSPDVARVHLRKSTESGHPRSTLQIAIALHKPGRGLRARLSHEQ